MKRLVCFFALLLITVPAWSAKNITVAELTDVLKTLHQANKSDADVAAALKQVQMSEELTRDKMNDVAEFVPGQLSTEQLYVLEARSAMMPPPPAAIPPAAAPDAAAQKAILDKADDYAAKTYDQLPALTASKATRRFQDNVEAVAPASGKRPSATAEVSPYQFVHFLNSTSADIVSEHGIERPAAKDKTVWGPNKMIGIQEPDPSLNEVYKEAKDAGSIKWLRWQMVAGTQVAVFAFDVPKKKSHLTVNICCFPNPSSPSETGVARNTSDSVPANDVIWHNYKSVLPYHGQFFIDPGAGTVVRMITQADLKSSEVVHQQDTRIDYSTVTVGGKPLVLPVKTVIDTEVVPNGDVSPGSTSERTTLFTAEYSNYQPAGGAK